MKQKAIIIDIDGTLCQSAHVDLYKNPDNTINWEKWMESNRFALVNDWCLELCIAMQRKGYRLIFLTARGEDFNGREITKNWLDSHLNTYDIYDYELIMRKDGDFRSSEQIKLDAYIRLILPHFNVLFAIDDQRNIVDLWKNLDIPSLHCADY